MVWSGPSAVAGDMIREEGSLDGPDDVKEDMEDDEDDEEEDDDIDEDAHLQKLVEGAESIRDVIEGMVKPLPLSLFSSN